MLCLNCSSSFNPIKFKTIESCDSMYLYWFWISFVDQPSIANKPKTIAINESEKVILFINITSNPLSNASWYDGTKLLKIQTSATTNYTIERASCEDSKNFSLVVSNGIGNAVNTSVELIVNCEYNFYNYKILQISGIYLDSNV